MGDFVQIHSLVSYPGVLLNRDDVGLAKRLPFGDATRIRVSSQCLKKHWRDALTARHAELRPSVRSREIFSLEIEAPLIAEGINADAARAAASMVAAIILKKAGKKDAAADDADGEGDGADETSAEKESSLATGQVLVMSRAEVEYIRGVAQRIATAQPSSVAPSNSEKPAKKSAGKKTKDDTPKLTKEEVAQLRAVAASFDSALFGRFITSDILARIDSAVSVAHAFTVHAEQAETDYFTAVDELAADAGAAMIGDAELTSGLFYVYAVIDLGQLKQNLGLQHAESEQLSRWLIDAIATVSPGAKRGSTAPYALSEFMLIERGSSQPRSLANSFRRAIRTPVGSDVLETAVGALLGERNKLSLMYGAMASVDRAFAASTLEQLGGVERKTLPDAIDAVFAG